MVFPANPYERSPKGDHNRRLSLGIDAAEFAATAGVSLDELKHYEFADVEEISDPTVADRVGRALERLEASVEPKVDNGPKPHTDTTAGRVAMALGSSRLAERLALADPVNAERMIASELVAVDPKLRLMSFGERARGPVRELLVTWRHPDRGEDHEQVIALPLRA
jgi:hypothetical protein